MKKLFLKIILIILGLFILSKTYHFVMMNKVYDAIEEFRNEENRYYSVTVLVSEEISRKEEIFVKQKIVKYTKWKENTGLYCEWKNCNSNESYSFNVDSKNLYEYNSPIENEKFLDNIPNFILSIYKNNKFNINKIFDVRYIIPTKYDGKSCYKISTKTEEIIIDKDTYLPLYSSIKTINLNENNKTENIYEFKVGEVTDEDVALPDFSDYTLNNEEN